VKPIDITVSEALASPRLFGPFFVGESWSLWKAVIKAMYAEPMNATELALFRSVAERDPPTEPVGELVAVAGRASGKDSVASAIAAITAVSFDPCRLRPGERAVVMCLACDREQAKIAFNYIAAYFREIPALAKLVTRFTDGTIELNNRVDIEVHTNSYRGVRGRSLLCAIFDETAFWRSEDSANPDFEVAGAVKPALGRILGSRLILISSAHKRSGLLYQRWKDFYGRNDTDKLVVRGSTLTFNPSFDAKIIEQQLAEDRQLFGAEYLSEWRDDLASFISRQLLEAAVDVGVLVRPPRPEITYRAFADPSGGVHDSFALGIAHQSKGNNEVLLDLMFEAKPPFNPFAVADEIAALLKEYHCAEIVGDAYAAKWVMDAFARIGVTYRKSEADRSSVYLDVLPLFTAGRVRLIDSPRLIGQFAGLERRTFATGRDRVDHGRSGHDDLANAAAGALVLAARRRETEAVICAPFVHLGSVRITDWNPPARF
jgi:hypothetical protein